MADYNLFRDFADRLHAAVAATTIGKAVIERQTSGDVHLVDRYNFNSAKWWSGAPTPLLPLLQMIVGRIVPEGTGYDARINLGNPDKWDERGNIVPPVPVRRGASILRDAPANFGGNWVTLR